MTGCVIRGDCLFAFGTLRLQTAPNKKPPETNFAGKLLWRGIQIISGEFRIMWPFPPDVDSESSGRAWPKCRSTEIDVAKTRNRYGLGAVAVPLQLVDDVVGYAVRQQLLRVFHDPAQPGTQAAWSSIEPIVGMSCMSAGKNSNGWTPVNILRCSQRVIFAG
jgi:hypothetical protein